MVATWNTAADVGYYISKSTGYYLGGGEPQGTWFAPAGAFGLRDGSGVDRTVFERLYGGLGSDHRPLATAKPGVDRVPAYDLTFSAPRSVSIAWAAADAQRRAAIGVAQARAVRRALTMVEKEATLGRRGRGGAMGEVVPLSAAVFQHGDSRPARHMDGHEFADPNLHSHAVVVNLAPRRDGTVGALHSVVLRRWKMAAGAAYHAALAHELSQLGYGVTEVGTNGIFELAGVGRPVIAYFSARRQEIEAELRKFGTTSREDGALAAAVTKRTRKAKSTSGASRDDVWAAAFTRLGTDAACLTSALETAGEALPTMDGEFLFAARMDAIPSTLTESEAVIDRHELVRSVTAALVGTGLPAERAEGAVEDLLARGAVVEVGRDVLGLVRYSTTEMIAAEREVVERAEALSRAGTHGVARGSVDRLCIAAGLSEEQTAAAVAATRPGRLAVVEGAPGTGKTTLLAAVVSAYRDTGYRVLGAASAWRVANTLSEDLGIEARAMASWLERIRLGRAVLDDRTVLLVDEAGLLAAREMRDLLRAADAAGAKVILSGDRQQLQPIAAGSGLELVTQSFAATRVETIVRQRDAWAREVVRDLGEGRAAQALQALQGRGRLTMAVGAKASVRAAVDLWQATRDAKPERTVLLLARNNAAVGDLSQEVRGRLRAQGRLQGPDVAIRAATASGHATTLQLADGDRVRFLVRNDRLGVVNGSVGTVMKVGSTAPIESGGRGQIEIEVQISDRRITFSPEDLADEKGRARLGWAYASTIYGAQGMTVDEAIVLLDPHYDRRDAYVAMSRAREGTSVVVDAAVIDRHLGADLPMDRKRARLVATVEQRLAWLAKRLTRIGVKSSTIQLDEPQSSSLHSRSGGAQVTDDGPEL